MYCTRKLTHYTLPIETRGRLTRWFSFTCLLLLVIEQDHSIHTVLILALHFFANLYITLIVILFENVYIKVWLWMCYLKLLICVKQTWCGIWCNYSKMQNVSFLFELFLAWEPNPGISSESDFSTYQLILHHLEYFILLGVDKVNYWGCKMDFSLVWVQGFCWSILSATRPGCDRRCCCWSWTGFCCCSILHSI
jgi:hypothetical protein